MQDFFFGGVTLQSHAIDRHAQNLVEQEVTSEACITFKNAA
jgi:hypothetical protein